MEDNKKIKHLEMIQEIIKRMASNSFMLKGWTVTLIAGIFVLSTKDADKLYFFIAYIPILVFWGLDSYYLLQERLYRSLYDKVRTLNENDIDFSMKATKKLFKSTNNKFCSCLFSKMEMWFYLPLVLVCTIVLILSYSCI